MRKRVEEVFGWVKTVGGGRKLRYRGVDRNQMWAEVDSGRIQPRPPGQIGTEPGLNTALTAPVRPSPGTVPDSAHRHEHRYERGYRGVHHRRLAKSLTFALRVLFLLRP